MDCVLLCLCFVAIWSVLGYGMRDREIGTRGVIQEQTRRQTEGQTDRQTDRQMTDRQMTDR